MPPRHAQKLGRHGEDLAVAHLEAAGYTVLARNVRLGGGELDVVAEEGGDVVFVEVKTRRSGRFGAGADAITPAKARALARAAQTWLARHGALDRPCRCDVVAIEEDAGRTDGVVDILRNALALGEYC